ncbi:hypothetical protein H312_03527, partial [Anncaliia algerae PRA339]
MKKAYDTSDRQLIYQILMNFPPLSPYVNIISNLVDQNTIKALW